MRVGICHMLSDNLKKGFSVRSKCCAHIIGNLLHQTESTSFLNQIFSLNTDTLLAKSFNFDVETSVGTGRRHISIFHLEINFQHSIIHKLLGQELHIWCEILLKETGRLSQSIFDCFILRIVILETLL